MQLTNLLLLTAAITSPILAIPADQQVLSSPSTKECGCHCKDNPAFSKIKHALKKASIIPSILPPFTPKCFVQPTYTHGKKHKSVSLGNKLKHGKTKKAPSLKIYCPNMKYTTGLTLALTDPDAPSRKDPKWGEMCHWVVKVGAVGPAGEEGEGMEFEVEVDVGERVESSKSDDLVKYKAPGPPPGTGYHRYVFVLLEGNNSNLTKPEDRQHWGTGKEGHGVWDWAKEEGLHVIGANWFVEKQKK